MHLSLSPGDGENDWFRLCRVLYGPMYVRLLSETLWFELRVTASLVILKSGDARTKVSRKPPASQMCAKDQPYLRAVAGSDLRSIDSRRACRPTSIIHHPHTSTPEERGQRARISRWISHGRLCHVIVQPPVVHRYPAKAPLTS